MPEYVDYHLSGSSHAFQITKNSYHLLSACDPNRHLHTVFSFKKSQYIPHICIIISGIIHILQIRTRGPREVK